MEDPTLGSKNLLAPATGMELPHPIECLRAHLEGDPKQFDLYIPSLAKKSGDQAVMNVLAAIQDFIDDPRRLSLLVLGDSGLGKSTLAKYLTRLLWQEYAKDPASNALPLLINLPAIDSNKRSKHLLHAHLKEQGIERKEERMLLNSSKLLIILDGYDEILEQENLWLKNAWPVDRCKVITFCRPEVLLARQSACSYQELFYPPLSTSLLAAKALSFQEMTLQPFTKEQIDQYLAQYVSQLSHSSLAEDRKDKGKEKEEEVLEAKDNLTASDTTPYWPDWRTYRHHIDAIPGLEELVETPFILSMVVQILPTIIAQEYSQQGGEEEGQAAMRRVLLNAKPLTRTKVYDYFVEHWFSYQAQRIQSQERTLSLLTGPLTSYLRLYTQGLAHRLLRAGKLKGVVREEDTLDKALLTPQDETTVPYYAKDQDKFDAHLLTVIRSGCLLKTEGGQFSFLHTSLLEYFAANGVFNSLVADADFILHFLKKEQGGFERDNKEAISHWRGTTFNQQLLVEEQGVLRVLAERAKQDTAFQALLFGIIEYSKNNPAAAIAASNAITILNQARISLSGKDFQGVHIPSANLSGALLAYSDFSDADLTNVWLRQAHLACTNFSRACLKDAKFGQLPAVAHRNEVKSLCYSPDGKWLATGDEKGHIYIWSQETGHCQRIFKNWRKFSIDYNPVHSLSFHPAQSVLAAGSEDGLVRLWQVGQGRCIRVLSGHTAGVAAVAFSLDGKYLASASLDKTICLWQVAEQRLQTKFRGHSDVVTAVAFSPDGKYLASGSMDKTICLWQVAEQRLQTKFQGHSDVVTAVAFSPDGQYVASGSWDKTIRLWQIAEQQLQAKLRGHTDTVTAVAFSPDGKYLVSGGCDFTVCLWQVAEQRLHTLLKGHTAQVTTVAFSPGGEYVASGSLDKTVRLWQIAEQWLQTKLEEDTHSISAVAFSPDGKYLASGSIDKTICLWQVAEQQLQAKFRGHTNYIEAVAFSSDSKYLASGGNETALLWQVAEQRLLVKLQGHTDHIVALAFSPDGKYLASGSMDKTICLWQVAEQRLQRKFCEHTEKIFALAFSPDGKYLAWGGLDDPMTRDFPSPYNLHLWQMAEQRLQASLDSGYEPVTTLAFSPNGKYLAAGFLSGRVSIWQVVEQRWYLAIAELQRGTYPVHVLAFSPDGKYLASGGDETVLLWQFATQQCITTLYHGGNTVLALHWHASNTQLIIVDKRMQKFVWRLPSTSQPQFALLEVTGSHPLSCGKMNIHDTFGLSSSNLALLRQQGAVGTPSKRQAFYSAHSRILELPDIQSRQAVAPARVLSIIDSSKPVLYDCWVVSLLRHPESNSSDHALVILEGISCFGKALVVKLHLVEDEEHLGRARILITTYLNIALEDREEVLKRDVIKQQQKGKFYAKSWSLSREQALGLFTDAKVDQDKEIYYHLSGDRSFLAQSSTSSHQDKIVHNCFTWAREKLHNLKDPRIQLPFKYSDFVAAKTSFYIGPEQGKQNTCLMM